MVFFTILDIILNFGVFTTQLGFTTTKYFYRLYKGPEKTDYQKFIEYMEERDNKKIEELEREIMKEL